MKKSIKHAYLISAYKNPEQVYRLISVLNADNASFFLHIDKKSDKAPFEEMLTEFNNKVQYIKREKIVWGGFGIVKAAINGFQAIDENGNYDYLHFLTAQDYPIKSLNEINNFFIENYGKSFLCYFSVPSDSWLFGGMDRIQNYHIGKRKGKSKISRQSLYYFNRIIQKTGIFKRKHPDGLKPFGGEGNMSLHKSAVQYILEYLENNPRFFNFHKYSFAPDEMMFHTILLNTSNQQLKKNLINMLLWYIDWTKPNAKTYPVVFGTEDFENIKNSTKLFARKFDIKYDSKILDLIDKELL